jgi:hypothetical protein
MPVAAHPIAVLGRAVASSLLALFVAILLTGPAAPSAHAAEDTALAETRDEASRPCPPGVDPDDPAEGWWCGYDPAMIVATEDGVPRLTAFREHAYVNIAAVPTPDTANLDWTCIDGACGGLLDREFAVGRELSHLWRPAAAGDPPLRMSEAQLRRAIKGRNSWLMWTGGNQAFWDHLARRGYGFADFLKLLDNRYIARADRFRKLGIVNEPGMRVSERPGPFGLHLDVPEGWQGTWPPEPGTDLPTEVPDPYVYGYSSGVMGMRLFPNPEFFFGDTAQAAQAAWDPERLLADPNYAKSPDLVRPYRVGMACGFCHVTFNPINPPADPTAPKWENISATVGGQHIKFGRIAAHDFEPTNLLWHLVNYPKPGTLDTSLVATDGINNPTVINGIYDLLPRVANSVHYTETAEPAAAEQPLLDLSVLGLDLPELPQGPDRQVMRVLADGADSVGGRLALARVYLNIGSFHAYWKLTNNLLVGVHPQRPFALDGLDDRSVYWNVNLFRTQNMAEYLTYASGRLALADAPGGAAHLQEPEAQIARGRSHFVTHCMACHSTRQPERFWDDPADWQRWVQDPDYLEQAAALAAQPDFRTGNFLATDARYPVTDIGLNTARFLADNARPGRVWQDFSSKDYKEQPPLGAELALAHPYEPERTVTYRFQGQAGPARVRPLPLANLWASAPFLHNNSVGSYPPGQDPGNYPANEAADVSVAGRMTVFQRSIEALLHLRPRDGYASIQRTTVDSRLELPRVVMIDFVRQQLGTGWLWAMAGALAIAAAIGAGLMVLGLRRLRRPGIGRVFAGLGVVVGLFLLVGSAHLAFKPEHRLGHIPAGTPVSLVANLNGPGWLAGHDQPDRVRAVAFDLGKVWLFGLDSLEHPRVPDLVDNLLALNKAPDLVLDRGHDFGGKDIQSADGETVLPALSPDARRDLIAYLKTL